jgi:SnoaL-like domain
MPGKTVEDRLRAMEDWLEIYNLVASHPPGADTGSDDWVRDCWVDDGVMDLGYVEKGRDAIAAVVKRPEHQAALKNGICHFAGLPHIQLHGDTAVVTSYLQILVPQTQGDPVSVPNHGTSKGFRAHRVGANRWDLVRTKDGWKIKHRVSRPLDGSEPARKVLRQALEDMLAKR